jgi:hypothetical protein
MNLLVASRSLVTVIILAPTTFSASRVLAQTLFHSEQCYVTPQEAALLEEVVAAEQELFEVEEEEAPQLTSPKPLQPRSSSCFHPQERLRWVP